jgi:poly(A) polymerase
VEWQFNEEEELILNAVQTAAGKLESDAYLIGGYVRDRILNRPTQDLDIVFIGDGIALAKAVAKHLKIRGPQIFKRFGTAMLNYNDLEIEFVGARKESYNADSRKPEVEPGTLEDDQNRRDLTINAMAICVSGDKFGSFLDPFDGMSDLNKRIIRTPLDPDITFSDDPLRMMRAIRFATQLDFDIHPETFEGIKRNSERIHIISQERITTELNKIILAPKPSIGWKLLMDTGLCALIAPEVQKLLGVDYVGKRGHKDNFYHTLEVLDNVAIASEDLWLRYAALLHDIGKPKTKRFDEKAGWTFHGHDAVGSYMVPKIFRKWKLPLGKEMNYVKKLVLLHLRPISLTNKNITDSAVRRLLFDAGEDIEDLMTLCQSDITTKNPGKMERYLANYTLVQAKMIELEESDRLRNWQPPITGEHIIETFKIQPSRQVGDIKTAIREAILDGVIPNDFDTAHDYMLKIGAEMGLSTSIK